MAETKVGRWGKSLAVRFPGWLARAAGLVEGSCVEIEALEGHLVVRPIAPHFSAAQLFDGKTPEEWRAEYAEAFSWGEDKGREAVEE